jgi:hypothetical protein
MMDNIIEQILIKSQDITNDNKQLSLFFNNSSMSKILDVFLNNPGVKITTYDLLTTSGLSNKAIFVNIPKLLKSGMVLEEYIEHRKLYLLNTKNQQAKQISQFRDTLSVKDVEQITRRVHFRHEPKRRTRQSKKISRKV